MQVSNHICSDFIRLCLRIVKFCAVGETCSFVGVSNAPWLMSGAIQRWEAFVSPCLWWLLWDSFKEIQGLAFSPGSCPFIVPVGQHRGPHEECAAYAKGDEENGCRVDSPIWFELWLRFWCVCSVLALFLTGQCFVCSRRWELLFLSRGSGSSKPGRLCRSRPCDGPCANLS